MADPNDVLSEFDLGGPNAAVLARARAAALRNQQRRAIQDQLSTVPELEGIGKEEYARAEKEREQLGAQSGHVLNRALQQKQYEKELAALQQQIEYQRGQLGLQGQQLGLE